MLKKLGKWQIIHAWWVPNPYSFRGRQFALGLIKFTNFPEVGGRVQRKHHKGVAVSVRIHSPIFTFHRRYIQVLGMQLIVTYPTRINFKYMFSVEVW